LREHDFPFSTRSHHIRLVEFLIAVRLSVLAGTQDAPVWYGESYPGILHRQESTRYTMITTLLLGSALATGQAPALPVIPILPAKVSAQAAPLPMPLPKVMPSATPMALPATLPPVVVSPAPIYVPAPAATEAPAAPAEEPPAPATKYLAEKLLEGTAFGQILSERGIKVTGWTQMNYTGSSASRSNAPTTFNDRANFFQMNQNWVDIAKNIDTSKNEFQTGFRVGTIVPGYDYKYTLPRGFLNGQSGQYGFDIPYLYGEAFLPGFGPKGTTLRAGRWGTNIGYETIDAVSTPFVSRSYNFQYNPFTHTGVQATSQISDDVTIYNGVVTGADVAIDPAATASYVGGIKWAPAKGKTSVAFNTFITGQGYNVNEAFQHFNSYNLILNHRFTDKFTYVLDATVSNTISTDPSLLANGRAAEWYGFANYFIYAVNDKVTSNLRVELFEDAQGVRTGTRGTYFAATYGLSWTPMDWMIVRPFARYDHNKNSPFEGEQNLYTGGMELILRY